MTEEEFESFCHKWQKSNSKEEKIEMFKSLSDSKELSLRIYDRFKDELVDCFFPISPDEADPDNPDNWHFEEDYLEYKKHKESQG